MTPLEAEEVKSWAQTLVRMWAFHEINKAMAVSPLADRISSADALVHWVETGSARP
jgi:hypothetical protein